MTSAEQISVTTDEAENDASTSSVLGGCCRSDGLAPTLPAYKIGTQPPTVAAGRVGLRRAALAAAACACVAVGFGLAWVVPGRRSTPGERGAATNAGGGLYAAAARASEDQLSFMVVGDWGRRGAFNQTAVARAMGACGAVSRPDFVVSVGDNFYEGGLNSLDDPEFAQSFTDVYTHPSLQVPWHAVLGNHDYGDCGYDDAKGEMACPLAADAARSPRFQLDPSLRRRDWRWRAGRSFDLRPSTDAHLFFVDTTPLVTSYADKTWFASVPEGAATQDAAVGAHKMGEALNASDAKWKLVFGHHPMRSNGFWSDVQDVRDALEVTAVRGGATAYFNGHDHDMQHTSVDVELEPKRGVGSSSTQRLHHFTSGAGSKTGRGFGVVETLFEHDGAGFASVRVSRGSVRVQFWGVGAGEGLLYTVSIDKPPSSASLSG